MTYEALQRGSKLAATLRKYHPDFPPNGLAIFLEVVKNEGQAATELGGQLDMAKATVSRNLRMMGSFVAAGKPGLGLIQMEFDIQDRRVQRAKLTDKGRQFAQELQEALA